MRRSPCPFDPPPEYAKIRDSEPPVGRAVLGDGSPVWLISRYEDVHEGFIDERISGDGRRPNFPLPGGAGVHSVPRPSFVRMDPPDHTAYRRLLVPDFTVRKVNEMRPKIQRLVDEGLDALEKAGQPADFYEIFALPVPSTVIADLLGIPKSEHEFFQSRALVALNRASSKETVRGALTEVREFLKGLLEHKRKHPADDLITKLATVPEPGEFEDVDLATAMTSLLNAGHETTANLIALGTLVLLDHPETLAELKADASLWPQTANELLRYLNVADLVSPRVAKEDIVISGQEIKAGDGLYFLTGSANRDERYFENADKFDIHRSSRGHVAFGYGIHQCLGQNLVRAEVEIVFESLFRRFPDLRVAVPMEELSFKHEAAVFGLHSLPVYW